MRLVVECEPIVHKKLKLLAFLSGKSLKDFLLATFDNIIVNGEEKYGDLVQHMSNFQNDVLK